MDDVLEAFLASPDEAYQDDRLGDILALHAAPIVRRVAVRRLGASSTEVDDVCSQVILQLMVRLRRERGDEHLPAIDAFAGYVATAAHHACDHVIRAKYPLRWRLQSRLRYILEHDRRFAIWRAASGTWLCGLAEWQSQPASTEGPSGDRLTGISAQKPHELLTRAFSLSGAPLELSAVVDAAATAWAIPLSPHDANQAVDGIADGQPRVDAALDQRGRLERIWTKIRELPLRQRHALLLNLKDDAITVFLATGAVSLRDIASCLELSVEDFATLWNDLPLPDNTVAERLGCTRQQVINLRMSARKRLANRLSPVANIGPIRAL